MEPAGTMQTGRQGRVRRDDREERGMTKVRATNITWHHGHIGRQDRERLLGQKGVTVWLTGLPSCGKSTIAFTLEHALTERGHLAYVLDGDNIRHGLNKNLGFSPEDREENIRRIGEVAKLFTDAGLITITSFISPYKADRDKVRALLAPGDFIEVFVDCPVGVCCQRDTKGLYKKAMAGEIKNFTGVNAPYEPPDRPECVIRSDKCTVQEAVVQLIELLEKGGKIPALKE
jgi:adenylylsulfate kinase